jgi:FtsP/CotA-like multicopper oxidase with cupredoxin domain
MSINRRDFLKYTSGGIATIIVGGGLEWILKGQANAQVAPPTINLQITDAMKEMVTHNSRTDARCYFWIYKAENLPPECPGPTIFTTAGTRVRIQVTNQLDEPHAFFIQGLANSGPIPPGGTRLVSFTPRTPGTFLYFDNLNAPVNRVMGLHGALVVMPRRARFGNRFTPYASPTTNVQRLFNDLGNSSHFPGLAWEEGDPATNTPPFRQHVWLLHAASPRLFEEVGRFPSGQDFPAVDFVQRFLNDPYANTFNRRVFNRKPHFFTINGQSGHFAHHNFTITPEHRVGEPVVIRILNAGLTTHSLHLHANHFYVIGVNGIPRANLLWLDTFTMNPLDVVEWLIPFTRPPDVPNERGIGLPDTPLISLANPDIPGSAPHPVWPPTEELDMFFPEVGTRAGNTDISVRLSPLCYPMHDHTEDSQVAQGGNYTLGMMSGMMISGDRNTPGGVTTFPEAHDHHEDTGMVRPAAGHAD